MPAIFTLVTGYLRNFGHTPGIEERSNGGAELSTYESISGGCLRYQEDSALRSCQHWCEDFSVVFEVSSVR